MSVFHHHHRRGGAEDPKDAASFEVLGADGTVMRYAREEFDEIVETTDAEEVQRQVDLGWAVLDERQVDSPAQGPSGEDLIPGIEGLRVGGILGYRRGESVTAYTIGFLRDGAHGELVE